ncbi:hypothetical protein HIM_03474 [Hirsutella minnesotensis 3608]|uniref:Uncharacterized protein n=1 Tax=Hirsutella minnesotensis 3608 TaxID=1043627 RepID=A0A0F7ZVT1_9HYPO|nr:hypothetical protein HIM_03474 [Hirsutella minnesotensis 3608]
MGSEVMWRIYQVDNDRKTVSTQKLGDRLIYLVNDNPLAVEHDFRSAGDPFRRYTPFPLVIKDNFIKNHSPENVVHKGYLREKDRSRWSEIVKAVLKEGPRELSPKELVDKVWERVEKEKLLVQ